MKTTMILPVIILLMLVSCKEQEQRQNLKLAEKMRADTMEKNFNRFIEEGWNQRDMSAFRDISVENYVRNLNGIRVAKHQNEMEANMNIYFTGFPDAKVVSDSVFINDCHLFTYWTFTGTNTGVFGEFPPTGKKVNVSGCSSLEFNEEGKMLQEDVYYNELALLQQLGYTLNPPVLK